MTETINHAYKVGDKIKFKREKQSYTVKSASDRYLICTKPMNALKTVIYTIVDFERGVRGPNNLIFNMFDYATQEECDESLERLISGDDAVSRRREVELDIEA